MCMCIAVLKNCRIHLFLSYRSHKNKVILILNLLHSMCPITITKKTHPHTHTHKTKAVIKSYITVCASRKIMCQIVPQKKDKFVLCYEVLLLYIVTKSADLSPLECFLQHSWRNWFTNKNHRQENCGNKLWYSLTAWAEMMKLSERQQILFWDTQNCAYRAVAVILNSNTHTHTHTFTYPSSTQVRLNVDDEFRVQSDLCGWICVCVCVCVCVISVM